MHLVQQAQDFTARVLPTLRIAQTLKPINHRCTTSFTKPWGAVRPYQQVSGVRVLVLNQTHQITQYLQSPADLIYVHRRVGRTGRKIAWKPSKWRIVSEQFLYRETPVESATKMNNERLVFRAHYYTRISILVHDCQTGPSLHHTISASHVNTWQVQLVSMRLFRLRALKMT